MKGRRLSARLVLAVASVSLLCANAGQQNQELYSWWLRTTFTPADTEYEGLSASAIDPDWAKITMFSYAAMPAEAKADFGWMRRQGFTFQVDQYFKRPGLEDRELCGVYETRGGKRGRFVLVLERKHGSLWKLAYVRKVPDGPTFSVFLRTRKALYWGTCMQCSGEFERLAIKKGKYYLDPTTTDP
jgi:hypothetical protein